MKPASRSEVLQILAGLRRDLQARYPIRRLGVFGSVARGEARAGSDVDVLVEFSAPVGWEVVDLADELEEALGCRVDLLTAESLRERLRPSVERDLVYV